MSPNHAETERLPARRPAWQIWRVDRCPGGPARCARPWDHAKPVLNAGSPRHLSEAIGERQQGWLRSAGPEPPR